MPDRLAPRVLSPSRPPLPRAVWILGWVSLATDAASEAIYPLLPFFVTHVLGGGALSLGIVEGAAEAANSLLKIASGALADRSSVKRPIVLWGYTLSSLARPLMSIARTWSDVLFIRFVDRVGKGIRSAPRDALLAAWATPATRGRVYSFHRGMDHAGAVVGPILATSFLWFYPGAYRSLFAAAIVPGALAVALIFFVKESAEDSVPAGGPRLRLADLRAVVRGDLGRFMAVLTVFMIGNSTDAFLLLRLGDALGGVTAVPLLWAALHVVKAGVSFAAADWSDAIGRRWVIGLGWAVYAIVYLGFAFSSSPAVLVGWFLLYGCYFGLAEGAEKALIADLAPPAQRGGAFGVYAATQGLGTLAASLVFGLVWTTHGPAVAFSLGSTLAMAAVVGLILFVPSRIVSS